MEKLFELDEIVSRINKQEDYFVSFLDTKGIDAGILKLHSHQIDTQGSHPIDEVYFVIEGNGFIEINDTIYKVKKEQLFLYLRNINTDFMAMIKTLLFYI